jgi:hypothetical protein
MGGIGILADCIVSGGDLQVQALRVIHTAAANNVKFQMKVLETEAGIVPWLLQARTTPHALFRAEHSLPFLHTHIPCILHVMDSRLC